MKKEQIEEQLKEILSKPGVLEQIKIVKSDEELSKLFETNGLPKEAYKDYAISLNVTPLNEELNIEQLESVAGGSNISTFIISGCNVSINSCAMLGGQKYTCQYCGQQYNSGTFHSCPQMVFSNLSFH